MGASVAGDDLLTELFMEDFGWQPAVFRRAANKDTHARRLVTKVDIVRPKPGVSAGARQIGDRLKRQIIKAALMPPLRKEDAKIIICPRRGLHVAMVGATTVGRAIMEAEGIEDAMAGVNVIFPNLQQNSVGVSPPDREHATRYTRIKAIEMANKSYKVSACEAALQYTCKGMIRGVSLDDGPVAPERSIVKERNPLALGAKRIKYTGTLIVAFDGMKVPNFVRYGAAIGAMLLVP
ncbi:hypothetical protein HPB49_022872 [Dermacentor silvarum]|uniref:Uncharacterized protein n=1 Tax=Dermacentor silvarum TaxID=543639 RepID=A0ACB8DRM0_DERSI|nr:hypothetical protein HPB49_022872 [Dermacentor silvarum]